MKLYITFGQDHTHRVNGITFDKDSDGRRIAMELFGGKFATSYTGDKLDLDYFPRGIFMAN